MFKVGDKVIDSQRGEGVVVEIREGKDLPVMVGIGLRYCYFTPSGNSHLYQSAQALFHAEGYRPPFAPEPDRRPDLAVDTKMLVRSTCDDQWKKRYLSQFGENGECYCFMNGTTKYSADGAAALWNFWKLYEGEE